MRIDEPAGARGDFLTALKEALIAAAVALGLFALLIGVRTEAGPSGALVVVGRFGPLAWFVAAAFVGRLVFAIARRRFVIPRSLTAPPAVKQFSAAVSPYF